MLRRKELLRTTLHSWRCALFVMLVVSTTAGQASKADAGWRFGYGAMEGDQSGRFAAAVEQVIVSGFPDVIWVGPGSKDQADLTLDLSVFALREDSRPFRQESRICKRFSASDPKAKNWLERAASRSCLEWDDRSRQCRKIQLSFDVGTRIKERESRRVVASARQNFVKEVSVCDPDVPDLIGLRTALEKDAAEWVAGRLATVPTEVLAQVIARSSRHTTPPQGQVDTDQAIGRVVASTQHQGIQQTDNKASALIPNITTQALTLVTRAEKRHALVIGNSNYPGGAKLKNPRADSTAIANRLRGYGFEVDLQQDVSRQALVSAIEGFATKAADADLTVFFFAGHGVQIQGINYLIPIDVDGRPGRLSFDAVPLNTLIDAGLPGKARLVFLDACRDNPWSASGARGISRGLAPLAVAAGTLISYATKDGSVALDGEGNHSPFTEALLEHLDAPEDIGVVLRRVRERVMRLTGGQQQPWEYGSLIGGELVLSGKNR